MTQTDLEQTLKKLADKFRDKDALKIDTTIQFCLSGGGGGDWFMTIHGPECIVERGIAKNPEATLEASVEDFINLVNGAQEEIGWAFMQGRFNMTGNISPLWRVLAFLRGEQSRG
jgi:putative sterol carrier protein